MVAGGFVIRKGVPFSKPAFAKVIRKGVILGVTAVTADVIRCIVCLAIYGITRMGAVLSHRTPM